MISSDLYTISVNVKGKLIGINKIIDNISIDSRVIKKNCLFIAFKGKKFDSHEFINDSIKNGAIAILVSKYIYIPNISQILVNDVNQAFFYIGKWIRNLSKAYVIAITGSCGKTSVKEITANILSKFNKISYTKNNENNIVGIVLTLLNIKNEDKFIIIEVGTDGLKQISQSVNLIKPDIILINNLFIAHFLKLKSWKDLSYAKGEILETTSNFCRLILNFDSNNWNYWKFVSFLKEPIFFSINKSNKTDFYISNLKLYNLNSNFTLNTPMGNINIKLNLPGLHNVYNAIAASTIAFTVGAKLKHINLGLSSFNSINQRLAPLFINKNKIILNDTYNANLGSFFSSLKVLENMPGYKILVIGNIYELGSSEIFLHKKMGFIIKHSNINKILSFGNLAYFVTFNNANSNHFYNKNDLVEKIIELLLNNDKISILIKASRNNNFNEIIENILYKIKNDNIFFL